VIDAATEPWGVKVNRIEIKDLTPPVDITNAMARQMKAERERRAIITEADGEKQAAIARAEGAKQAAILEAEGRKEAAFRDAEAREREAEAEARATAMVSQAIAAGDVNAINYFVAQKYVEAFAELARSPNQKTVIVPAEMGGLVGTIAGLGELVGLAKEQQQDRRDDRQAARPAQRATTPNSPPPPQTAPRRPRGSVPGTE
jgi:regulator of protease activity HflC (stomatin/prohibitin superfamily)